MASKPVRKEAPPSARAVRDLRALVREIGSTLSERIDHLERRSFELENSQRPKDAPYGEASGPVGGLVATQVDRAGPSEPRGPVLLELVDRMEALLGRMDIIANEITGYNDDRLGATPQDPQQESPRPPRPGRSGAVLDLVDVAHRMATRIEDQVRRLNAL